MRRGRAKTSDKAVSVAQGAVWHAIRPPGATLARRGMRGPLVVTGQPAFPGLRPLAGSGWFRVVNRLGHRQGEGEPRALTDTATLGPDAAPVRRWTAGQHLLDAPTVGGGKPTCSRPQG